VYDSDVLHSPPSIARLVLGGIAAALWALYLHEALFRSGKVQMHWVKRRLLDLLVMLLIAGVTYVFGILVGAISFHHVH